ncbi:glutamate synthase large subunit [Herpetosiphon geysericola]|uniref:Glutamate synthase n=1 Tax=Herpetosiphon geysericola TaxID=70996 RepID=A0A0P6Y2N0_9CHLR|nr:glutamate synthase large subunit [Herpetosiphon geysericola]KPL83361.1 glutamate synthase [Herpetosiphon geysericola]
MNRLLYDPRFEHDACGIGFVARIDGKPTHATVSLALAALGSLTHRGGIAADGLTGDGAGLLTTIPRAFMARELAARRILANPQRIAVGMIFLPTSNTERARELIDDALVWRGLRPLGWREVPLDREQLGPIARDICPQIEQIWVDRPATMDDDSFERELYRARRRAERTALAENIDLYIPSLSCRTIVYKGLMLPSRLALFYPDLADADYSASAAVYHQRYSTNTMPTWSRAQPFRVVSHNGEINTLTGNVNWMRAREAHLSSPLLGNVRELAPIVDERGSDSAQFDNVLELLVRAGRDVRHSLLMMMPEAWEHIDDLPQDVRDFYQWHANLMEAWDGPAAMTFCDGKIVGSALDRNGLRPARYIVTDDGLVVVGSEVGATPVDEDRIIRKGRLGPGQMIAVDLIKGQLLDNTAVKAMFAARQPYGQWLQNKSVDLAELVAAYTEAEVELNPDDLLRLQAAFGYTDENLAMVLKPMGREGAEPIGSMGDDTPMAVFSNLARPVYGYLKQRFAEVTNPPIDPLREQLVMSLSIRLGPRHNILIERPDQAHQIALASPILRNIELAALRACPDRSFGTATLDTTFPVTDDAQWIEHALDDLCSSADRALDTGATILVLSDREVAPQRIAIPTVLALGAVHHHLIRTGRRSTCSLIVETGEAHEVHHVAVLVGNGAEAVNPYVAIATIREIAKERSRTPITADQAEDNYVHSLEKGLLKVMSKMGISTVDSYCGAQIFEAIGLSDAVIARCLTGTPSRFGGADWQRLGRESYQRHAQAFGLEKPALSHPGLYKFRKDGEYHAFQPAVVHALQKAVRAAVDNGADFEAGYATYREYSDLLNKRQPSDPRDLLDFVATEPIAIDEVESIETIVKRFSTAAISYGSLSAEAHETLAVAMNRLGGMSNSGEGGEDPARFGTEKVSAIKQIASGRFGVTPSYLMNARELQIKMAQGSKPGEGGQIPGNKVTEDIARTRHTTPGVTLISPPPHHDIYSIEDLAQLIYDMRTINPTAAVSVKLVSEMGVGTIAAGVVKGGADVVLISGNSGGTGASPLSSIKNVGIPWEIGLAETQQTLMLNQLRDRVRVRADGGLRTGRDVVMAALLGADEYSFGTSALIAEGCVMARACHNNTCPVGIATQRPDLRAKFPGKPEHVMAFMQFIAQEVRELLAQLGARSLNEIIGRVELLRQRQTNNPDHDALDLSPLLGLANAGPRRFNGMPQLVGIDRLNQFLVDSALPSAKAGQEVIINAEITNEDRSTGITLAGELALLKNTGHVTMNFAGSAGQSFAAFATRGMQLNLVGDANDYVGKGLAGGEVVIKPRPNAQFLAHEATILGNTALYGATSGSLYAAGRAGERFAVRNSGAVAIIEGIGEHGCEYMTGGTVVVLGSTGNNFGAGMSGGQAFVYDPSQRFLGRLNDEMVIAERVASPLVADHLRELIERHAALTGSVLANEILANWEDQQSAFWHVISKAAHAAAAHNNQPELTKVAA